MHLRLVPQHCTHADCQNKPIKRGGQLEFYYSPDHHEIPHSGIAKKNRNKYIVFTEIFNDTHLQWPQITLFDGHKKLNI